MKCDLVWLIHSQLVVVGDQSSGKSSVLEGLTGFAFPRAAELCTRYATQITCRRETLVGIAVSIIPHENASPEVKQSLLGFKRILTELQDTQLATFFKEANGVMGIDSLGTGSAFSEHVLKIEITGPDVSLCVLLIESLLCGEKIGLDINVA